MPSGDRASVSVLREVGAESEAHPSQGAAMRLAAMMAVAGTLHFVKPTFFDQIIPRALPGSAQTYTPVSGVAAYAVAAALAAPRTRRAGSAMAMTFFVAVFPAKVQLTVSWFRDEDSTTAKKVSALVQLPLQIPLITEALKARRNAPHPSR